MSGRVPRPSTEPAPAVFNRRMFLGAGAVVLGAGALAACGGSSVVLRRRRQQRAGRR